MSKIDPPQPPTSASDGNPVHRANFRLWQIVMSAGTLVATIWFFKLNPIAGIIAAFVAKHVLVAIYVAGLKTHDKPA